MKNPRIILKKLFKSGNKYYRATMRSIGSFELPPLLQRLPNFIIYIRYNFGVGTYHVTISEEGNFTTVLKVKCKPDKYIIKENKWEKIFSKG